MTNEAPIFIHYWSETNSVDSDTFLKWGPARGREYSSSSQKESRDRELANLPSCLPISVKFVLFCLFSSSPFAWGQRLPDPSIQETGQDHPNLLCSCSAFRGSGSSSSTWASRRPRALLLTYLPDLSSYFLFCPSHFFPPSLEGSPIDLKACFSHSIPIFRCCKTRFQFSILFWEWRV